MVYPRELEDMIFEEVSQVIKKNETKEEIGYGWEDEIPVKNTRTEWNHFTIYSQVEAGDKTIKKKS